MVGMRCAAFPDLPRRPLSETTEPHSHTAPPPPADKWAATQRSPSHPSPQVVPPSMPQGTRPLCRREPEIKFPHPRLRGPRCPGRRGRVPVLSHGGHSRRGRVPSRRCGGHCRRGRVPSRGCGGHCRRGPVPSRSCGGHSRRGHGPSRSCVGFRFRGHAPDHGHGASAHPGHVPALSRAVPFLQGHASARRPGVPFLGYGRVCLRLHALSRVCEGVR